MTPQTLASVAIAGVDENRFIEAQVPAGPLLVSGTNVIAVELHQASADSTDISFDLEFSAVAGQPRPPQLAALRVGNLVRLRWPASAPGFRPWQSTNLATGTPWQPVPGTIIRNGPWLDLGASFSPAVRFFQLRNE